MKNIDGKHLVGITLIVALAWLLNNIASRLHERRPHIKINYDSGFLIHKKYEFEFEGVASPEVVAQHTDNLTKLMSEK